MAARSSAEVLRTSTLMMSAMSAGSARLSPTAKSSSAIMYPASFRRWQAAMTRSSGSTLSRISTTVWLEAKGYIFFQQHVPSAVDEGASAVAEHVESHDQGAVQHDFRSRLGIFSAEIVFYAVAEQQFIAEDLLFPGENRLTGHKTQTGPRSGLGQTRIGCRCRGVHAPFIGSPGEKVQAQL